LTPFTTSRTKSKASDSESGWVLGTEVATGWSPLGTTLIVNRADTIFAYSISGAFLRV